MGLVGVASLLLVAFVACSQAQADANTQQLARQFNNQGSCLFPGMACGIGSCECRARTNIIVVVVINNRRQRRRLWQNCQCQRQQQNPIRPQPRRPRVNRPINRRPVNRRQQNLQNLFTISCGRFAGGRPRFCHQRCQRCSNNGRFQQCVSNGRRQGCADLAADEAPEQTVDAQGNPVETAPAEGEDLDDAAESVKPETETVTSTESVEKATGTDVAADEMTQLVKEAEKKIGEVIDQIKQDEINLGPKAEKALAVAAANMKTVEKIAKAIENDEVEKMSPEQTQAAIDAEKKAEGAETADDETAEVEEPTNKNGTATVTTNESTTNTMSVDASVNMNQA